MTRSEVEAIVREMLDERFGPPQPDSLFPNRPGPSPVTLGGSDGALPSVKSAFEDFEKEVQVFLARLKGVPRMPRLFPGEALDAEIARQGSDWEQTLNERAAEAARRCQNAK